MFNFENIFANLTYTKQLDAIKNKALLTGVNQVSSAVNMNSNFPEESLSGSANYGRSFFKYYKAKMTKIEINTKYKINTINLHKKEHLSYNLLK